MGYMVSPNEASQPVLIERKRKGKPVEVVQQENCSARTTVKLLSVEMCDTPSLLTWAINGYRFKADRPKLRRVFTDGYGLTDKCADDLLSGRVPFQVEDGNAVFKYEAGKAKQVN